MNWMWSVRERTFSVTQGFGCEELLPTQSGEAVGSKAFGGVEVQK